MRFLNKVWILFGSGLLLGLYFLKRKYKEKKPIKSVSHDLTLYTAFGLYQVITTGSSLNRKNKIKALEYLHQASCFKYNYVI